MKHTYKKNAMLDSSIHIRNELKNIFKHIILIKKI